jgi:WD40 repeat protein
MGSPSRSRVLAVSITVLVTLICVFASLPVGARNGTGSGTADLETLPLNRKTSLAFSPSFEVDLSGAASALAWSYDSHSLAAVSQYGNLISLIDADGKLLGSAKRAGLDLGTSLAILPNSNRILFGSSQLGVRGSVLSVWDVPLGRPVSDIPGEGMATVFDLSPDGSTVAVRVAVRRRQFKIVLYRVGSWAVAGELETPEIMSAVRFAANGQTLIMGSNKGNLYSGDWRSERVTRLASPFFKHLDRGGNVRSNIQSLAGSPDGTHAIVGVGLWTFGIDREDPPGPLQDQSDAEAWIRAVPSVQMLSTSPGERTRVPPCNVEGEVQSVVWDPRNRFVAFSDGKPGVYFWNPADPTGSCLNFPADHKLTVIAVSPDGSRLAVSTNAGVKVFRIKEVSR